MSFDDERCPTETSTEELDVETLPYTAFALESLVQRIIWAGVSATNTLRSSNAMVIDATIAVFWLVMSSLVTKSCQVPNE